MSVAGCAELLRVMVTVSVAGCAELLRVMVTVVCAGCAAADDGEGIKDNSFLSDM